MPPDLPIELLRSIVHHVSDKESLLSLLSASHVLSEEAERLLYYTFNTYSKYTSDSGDGWLEVPETNLLGFLNRVVASDRVASYVYRVNMEQLVWYGSQEFWDTFEQALPRMKNLKVLAYFSSNNHQLSRILAQWPSQFQLKILEWNCSGCDDDLKVFLPFQRQLERIMIYGWVDEEQLVMPSLKDLRTDSKQAIMALIPGGHVQSLTMNFHLPVDLPTPFPDDLLAGLESLSTLEIGTHTQTTPWLVAFADHLENVRILDVSGQEPPEFSRLLRRLPQLQILTLTQLSPRPTKALIKSIFRRNKKLEAIDVRNDMIKCVRWLRDSDTPFLAPRKYFFSYLPWNNGEGEDGPDDCAPTL